LVLLSHRLKVSREVSLDRRWEQCYAVLLPLAVSDQDVVHTELHILDPQLGTFQEPEPGTVEQGSHQTRGPAKMGQHGLHLFSGQDDGEADRSFGPDDSFEPRQVLLQDFSIQKEECTQGLVLSRGRYTAVKREG
jgi:hypothetical protein